jgi:hypothetical protein
MFRLGPSSPQLKEAKQQRQDGDRGPTLQTKNLPRAMVKFLTRDVRMVTLEPKIIHSVAHFDASPSQIESVLQAAASSANRFPHRRV